jgi:hypothetical protein
MSNLLHDDAPARDVELQPVVARPHPPTPGQYARQRLGPADCRPIAETLQQSQNTSVDRLAEEIQVSSSLGRQVTSDMCINVTIALTDESMPVAETFDRTHRRISDALSSRDD